MATFISLAQFATEKKVRAFDDLKDSTLYVKKHSNGETESVKGIKCIAAEPVCLALSKSLSDKSAKELATIANKLSVAVEKYLDKDGHERTSYLLCTAAEREGLGNSYALEF